MRRDETCVLLGGCEYERDGDLETCRTRCKVGEDDKRRGTANPTPAERDPRQERDFVKLGRLIRETICSNEGQAAADQVGEHDLARMILAAGYGNVTTLRRQLAARDAALKVARNGLEPFAEQAPAQEPRPHHRDPDPHDQFCPGLRYDAFYAAAKALAQIDALEPTR